MAGVTFFRCIGGSMGVAVFGAVFAAELTRHLRRFLATTTLPLGFNPQAPQAHPEILNQLPAVALAGFRATYAAALETVFLVAVPFGVVAFALAVALRELPLRATAAATDPGDTFTMPQTRDSGDEMARALAVLARRHNVDEEYRQLAEVGKVPLEPACCRLVECHEQRREATPTESAEHIGVPIDRIQPRLRQLVEAGLITIDGVITVTDAGQRAAQALLSAWRSDLQRLLAGWPGVADDGGELDALTHRIAGQFSGDTRCRDLLTSRSANAVEGNT